MENRNKNSIFRIFGNPGQVIRVFALVVFFAGCLASVILAWDASYSSYETYSRYSGYTTHRDFEFGTFLGILLGGCAISWASGLILMAAGDTVLNIKRMADKLCGENAPVQAAPVKAQEEAKPVTPAIVNAPAWAAPESGKDIAEQIKELARFYNEGGLTEEEFTRKKTELLKKL